MKAHILVCFLAYVLRKTLEGWSKRAGLGSSISTLLEEFARIDSTDVTLPTTDDRDFAPALRRPPRPGPIDPPQPPRPGPPPTPPPTTRNQPNVVPTFPNRALQNKDLSAISALNCGSWVNRGGCWFTFAAFCRSATRSRNSPGNRSYYLGFRVALSSSSK